MIKQWSFVKMGCLWSLKHERFADVYLNRLRYTLLNILNVTHSHLQVPEIKIYARRVVHLKNYISLHGGICTNVFRNILPYTVHVKRK